MTKITALPDPRAESRKADAQMLRDFADEVERGDVTEWVIAGNHRKDGYYFTSAGFEDRWRMIAAIEYAKGRAVSTNSE